MNSKIFWVENLVLFGILTYFLIIPPYFSGQEELLGRNLAIVIIATAGFYFGRTWYLEKDTN